MKERKNKKLEKELENIENKEATEQVSFSDQKLKIKKFEETSFYTNKLIITEN